MPQRKPKEWPQLAFPFAIIWRTTVFSGLWWGLTEGHADSWLVGVPIVAAATTVSYWLRTTPPWHWRILGGLAFAVFFFWKSLRAGIDVAGRTVTLDLAPRIIAYHVSLQQPAARTFFAGVISLLPGTLTTAIDDDVLRIHALDVNQPHEHELKRLEARVAAMFGETIRCKSS